MWGWIAGALALLPVLLVLALFVPVDVSVRRELGERARVRIGWMWDRVGFDLHGKAREKTEAESESKTGRPLAIGAMLQTEGFPAACARCVWRLWRSWRLRELRARVHIGGADPAETGMLAGTIAPLTALAAVGATIEIAPDFERERLDAEGRAAARVWPALALAAMIAFLLTPATIRAIRRGRRAA